MLWVHVGASWGSSLGNFLALANKCINYYEIGEAFYANKNEVFTRTIPKG
jgi:hypothetical protein